MHKLMTIIVLHSAIRPTGCKSYSKRLHYLRIYEWLIINRLSTKDVYTR